MLKLGSLLSAALISTTASHAYTKSLEIQRRNHQILDPYTASLPRETRKKLDWMIKTLVDTDENLVHLSMGRAMGRADDKEKPVFLFVHGLGLEDGTDVWRKPIGQMWSHALEAYMYKWSKWTSLDTAADGLIDAVETLREYHPGRQIAIVAHCAGGVVSLVALDKLQREGADGGLFLSTAASPIFGYEAPRIAYAGAVAVGLATIELGRGGIRKLRSSRLRSCMNWVNTDCSLDRHACLRDGVSPQTGSTKHPQALPCGTVRMGQWTHDEILQVALDFALASVL